MLLGRRINKIPIQKAHSEALGDIEGGHEYTAAWSHPSGQRVNTDCNPTAKAEPEWFLTSVCVCVCVCVCVVGLALAGKGQGMAQIR